MRAVAEGSRCLSDYQVVFPHLRFALGFEGPTRALRVDLSCGSTQPLRFVWRVEYGGPCERPSLALLHGAGENEQEIWADCIAGCQLIFPSVADGVETFGNRRRHATGRRNRS